MPELPEVESIKRYWQKHVEKEKLPVKDVIFHRFQHKKSSIVTFADAEKTLTLPQAAQLWRERVQDCTVTLRRRGKYLLFFFHTPKNHSPQPNEGALVVHLRMSGAFFHVEGLRDFALSDHQWKNHVHITFVLGNERYVFFDPRTFGTCHCFFSGENVEAFLATKKLGAEASDVVAVKKSFSAFVAKKLGVAKNEKSAKTLKISTAAKITKTPKNEKNIKSLLLDQNVVCGLGNIYVNESLFAAKVRPERRVFSITPAEWKKIATAIEKVIAIALEAQGVTLEKEGGYRLPDGSRGRYIARAFVYGRAGQSCFLCGTLIKKIVQNGRSTFFCEKCQK